MLARSWGPCHHLSAFHIGVGQIIVFRVAKFCLLGWKDWTACLWQFVKYDHGECWTGLCTLRENFYKIGCSQSSSGSWAREKMLATEKEIASPANCSQMASLSRKGRTKESFLICKHFYPSSAGVKHHSHNPSVSALVSSGTMMDAWGLGKVNMKGFR